MSGKPGIPRETVTPETANCFHGEAIAWAAFLQR
jgi:hypothetical protein